MPFASQYDIAKPGDSDHKGELASVRCFAGVEDMGCQLLQIKSLSQLNENFVSP